MPLTSDLTLNASKFDPANIPQKALALNAELLRITETLPKWWETGAAKFREMRRNGETAFAAPIVLPEGKDRMVPSREPGRSIPCRVFYPQESKKPKGVIMHIHGGGWVLGDEKGQDGLLKGYADEGFVTISAGYRLAPEDPFPAGVEDCEDVSGWLVESAVKEFGGELKFVTGESAGGHLSLLTAFHLLRKYPSFSLLGLLLNYGCYDLSRLPQAQILENAPILTGEILNQFFLAFVPGVTGERLKNAAISPFYEDLEQVLHLHKHERFLNATFALKPPLKKQRLTNKNLQWRGRLPKALFTVGTVDVLMDDSVCMAARWMVAGGHACLRIYNGAAHGFVSFGRATSAESGEVMDDIRVFIEDCIQEKA